MVTAARLASRRLLLRPEGQKDLELGELLTGQLDEMKGLAMKLGQIVSYMDVPLPDAVQEQLAELQTGIQGLSEAETKQALVSALGEDYASMFEDFNYQPIAAASIGQVHRVRARGKELALKLRYPGIADSFKNDLSAVNRLAGLASLATAVDGKRIVEELASRLEEECDYQREASFQESFATAFSLDDTLIVPRVISEFCTKTTLATEWQTGMPFAEAIRQPQETRNRLASQLVRFSYRSLFCFATIQADPHPGNFLFRENGDVILLDFGCVRQFESSFVDALRRLVIAIDRADKPAFRRVMIELKMAPKPQRFDFDFAFDMMEHLHRPLLRKNFHFTREFLREGFAFNGPTNPNARTMSIPPPYVWVARLQWGLWSVLTKLDAQVSLRECLFSILEQPIGPMEISSCHGR